MPLNTSIKKVLVIGSGPIIIGQAAEFDYSGTQACRALKEEGVETVLVNSNPATIMTDKSVADRVYIEPLTIDFIEKIIEKEKPDGILPGMGGQTSLNLVVDLYDRKILERNQVKVIGTSIASIKTGEDREAFRKKMEEIGQPIVKSEIIHGVEEGIIAANHIGYPVIVRPAYTLGGSGGGIAENEKELLNILSKGLNLSRNRQVLIEKSIKGWKEIEYEVMRDGNGTCITVCNMENMDPVGIHTGDSIVVAPSQTLSDVEHQMLRTAALKIIDEIEIKGGCNVQFALNPDNFEYIVIEINPRVSRSSALASKATGYPIAKVAAKIALGLNLDEIENSVTKKTTACFEPVLDYVVVKIPKWPFDKLYSDNRRLGTQMIATGEVMGIGNNFEAALLKALRSLEISQFTLINKKYDDITLVQLKEAIAVSSDELLYILASMLRRGYSASKIHDYTKIDPFFIQKIRNIIEQEELLRRVKLEDLTPQWLNQLKRMGFSDKGMADLMGCEPDMIFNRRLQFEIYPTYKMVDTCSGEFEAETPYYYSTYDNEDEMIVSDKNKIVVIGSGPIRIGQGVEFDYCCVHCVTALKNLGYESIMINNNPETVSTDFDMSDKLYFEPLTEEDVYNVILKEKPVGVILQFGGQTAIKLAEFIKKMGVNILGTTADHIDMAEDRDKFDDMMEKLNVKRPIGKGVWNINEGQLVAEQIGYPVLVRPSYVLGGQGMEIAYHEKALINYLEMAFKKDKKHPVLIDKYMLGLELEVDVIADGEEILIPGIMEHLEKAGVHSGDSISIYPTKSLTATHINNLEIATRKIALELGVKGILNVQFVLKDDEIYVIEVNPRSSRTVPFISKVTNIPMIELAVRTMMGEKLKDMGFGIGLYQPPNMVAIKVPVFSSQKIGGTEVSLGPEMKSTGEVLGIGRNYHEALIKGFISAGINPPDKSKKVVVTIKPEDKSRFMPLAKRLESLGYQLYGTKGTYSSLKENGVKIEKINKIGEPNNILDLIDSGNCGLVINTPTKANDSTRDGFIIRRKSVENGVLLLTNLDTLEGLLTMLEDTTPLQELPVFEIEEVYTTI